MSENKDILTAILNDANDYATKIMADADLYKQKVLESAKAEIEDFDNAQKKLINDIVEDIKFKKSAVKRMDEKKAVLQTKTEIIDSVYQEVLKKLHQLNEDEYLTLIDNLVTKYGEKNDTLILSKGITFDVAKVEGLNSVKNLSLKVQCGGDFDGGFILTNVGYDKDFSFNSVVKSMREKTESKVAERLFGNLTV